MPPRIRRLLPFVLGLALLLPAAVPVAAVSSSVAASAEASMVKLVNAERRKRGLVPMRIDTRLAAIARERSDYQAQRDVGSHTHSGGQTVFDLIDDANIRWYAAGEIIAQNRYYPTLLDSAKTAVSGWLGSSSHRAIMLSKGYNYVGIGFAANPDSERRYWTAVFMKGPDRTRPWANTGSLSKKSVTGGVKVTLRWGGGDRKLQVLTSGLRYFQVQRRTPTGNWKSWPTTTSTYKRVTYKRNRTIYVRVRSRDRASNWSTWHTIKFRT